MPSDISSAGITRVTSGYGSTSRKDVLRRVEVPVVPGAAARTRPVPGGKLQLGEQVSTRRAGLAGRVPAVDHDHIGRTHQRRTCAVQEVLTGVASLAMSTCDFDLRLPAIVAARPAARQPALVTGQVSRLASQVTWVGNSHLVAGHQKVRQAEVDTNCVPGRRNRGGCVDIDSKRHVPAAVRLSRDNHHRRVECCGCDVTEGPREPQRRVGLRQRHCAVAHSKCRPGVVRALAASAGLEPAIMGSPGEEVLEGGVLVPQRLLKRHTGHLRQEGKLFGPLPLCQCCISLTIRRARACDAVTMIPLAQCLVPHEAYTPEGAIQHFSLFGRRIGPASVRRPHNTQRTGTETMSKTPPLPKRREFRRRPM